MRDRFGFIAPGSPVAYLVRGEWKPGKIIGSYVYSYSIDSLDRRSACIHHGNVISLEDGLEGYGGQDKVRSARGAA